MKCIITTEYQTHCEIIDGRPGLLDKRIVIVSHLYLAGDGATYENFKALVHCMSKLKSS